MMNEFDFFIYYILYHTYLQQAKINTFTQFNKKKENIFFEK